MHHKHITGPQNRGNTYIGNTEHRKQQIISKPNNGEKTHTVRETRSNEQILNSNQGTYNTAPITIEDLHAIIKNNQKRKSARTSRNTNGNL